ncbi:ABC transporter ATP-binding protein [Cohnella silvisoli]|uniref:ATP-binding cassette domain-containing protein n=1 Tax=Cohnella silvisoli TaxID=2873699 RepID=A0ABV1KLU9_9BACL|nr:ATP-binding cassette domain-containing protein [Cohnella silvisoli]MCD9020598.1 ATP-binding cassette domain-containing protein [Cohnella silvisoli]
MEQQTIIKVQNLHKQYKQMIRHEGKWGGLQDLVNRKHKLMTAVDNVSFEVESGEAVAFIGPNGAGKSTVIKMLVGVLAPTSGLVEVEGRIPHGNRLENAKRIGVVFGQRTQLFWDIPLSESLHLARHMYKIPQQQFKENMLKYSEVLGLHEYMNVAVRQLSLGQRMRAELCAALLHNPRIVFLDEPTIGLDVVVKEKFRSLIRDINEKYHTTILLTTHDMVDIEQLCSRVIVIDHGNILFDGKLDQLKRDFGSEEKMTLEMDSKLDDFREIYELGVKSVEQEDRTLQIVYDNRRVSSSAIISNILSSYTVKDLIVQQIEIEEIIKNLYKNRLT